jgi:hypothetical protein
MPQENEIQVSVQGTEVIETTSISKSFDKAEYLAQKEAELVEHDAGVKAYIDAQAEVRTKLVALINEIK